MGIFKALFGHKSCESYVSAKVVVYCSECCEWAGGDDVSTAIEKLQSIPKGCGQNCHKPEIQQ